MGSIVAVLLPMLASGAEKESLYRWRTEVERIYHEPRIGPKMAFEVEFPPAVIQRLVDADLHNETVLREFFGVDITAQMIADETMRIDQSSQAPATLAKIKTALGTDGNGFAECVVKPIIVERLLRQKYYRDKTIHAAERTKAAETRQRLHAGKPVDGMIELTWLLSARSKDESAAPKHNAPTQLKSSGGAYTNEATVQVAEVIGGPQGDESKTKDQYFEDLPTELREVLKTQLRQAGNVSSVVETPEGFSIYRAKELNPEKWKVETVFIPRKSYDAWLAGQVHRRAQ